MRFLTVVQVLCLLSFFSCRTTPYEITKKETVEYRFNDSSNAAIDSSIDKDILPYRQNVKSQMSAVLCVSKTELDRGLPEGRLGDLVADACMAETKKIFYPADGIQPDFALFNSGGLRRAMPQGPITRGDIFELMPFENELVVLIVSGDSAKRIFSFIASKGGAPVSGVRFGIENGTAKDIMVNGQPFDSTRSYKVLTSDYLANGGDQFTFFSGAAREVVGLKVRDAIINYLLAKSKIAGEIEVNLDGRITDAR